MLLDLFLVFIAYVIGSIPSGLLIARMSGIPDIRQHGSGNIGATNVSRVLGYQYFIIVLCADSMKAYAYLAVLGWCGYSISVLVACGAALFLGNGLSLFLKFRGGKGVATLVGILAYLAPTVLLGMMLVWLVVLAITQTVGIASVVSFIVLPLIFLFQESSILIIMFACFMSVLGIAFHRDNIIKAMSPK